VNRVVLIGRIGRAPEIRETASGKTLASFRIAVPQRRGRRGGESGGEEAQWFSVAAWDATAEYLRRYAGQGARIAVDGRLESRKWVDSAGNRRESVDIVADSVQLLDWREGAETGERQSEPSQAQASSIDDYDPFAETE
jgi:single-strand DNA-binding protein